MAKKLATAYYNLSIMLDAGLPMLRAFDTVSAGLKGNLKKTFSALARGVSGGENLAETMKKYPSVFAPLDVRLVEAADMSGNLPQSFKLLSQWYDFRNRLKNIFISGLMLPFAIINIAAVIIPLPRLILGYIGVINYFIQALGILAFFYVPAGIVIAIYRLTPNAGLLRELLDALVIKIPVLGSAVRQLAISRFCRTFNMLYMAGVPITECAQKASGATGNAVMANLLKGGSESAQAGRMVYEGFSRKLPTDFLQLWQIGEETGELDKTIKRLADNNSETAEWLFVEFCRWLTRIIYFIICALLAIQILIMGIAAFGGGYGMM